MSKPPRRRPTDPPALQSALLRLALSEPKSSISSSGSREAGRRKKEGVDGDKLSGKRLARRVAMA
jgi:hypothetical protein